MGLTTLDRIFLHSKYVWRISRGTFPIPQNIVMDLNIVMPVVNEQHILPLCIQQFCSHRLKSIALPRT